MAAVPVVGAYQITLYPVNSGGVSGYVDYSPNGTFSTERNAITGTGSSYTTSATVGQQYQSNMSLANDFNLTFRSIYGFGLSSIPSNALIQNVNLFLRMGPVTTGLGTVSYAVTSMNLISPTKIQTGDYNIANYSSTLLSPYAQPSGFGFSWM